MFESSYEVTFTVLILQYRLTHIPVGHLSDQLAHHGLVFNDNRQLVNFDPHQPYSGRGAAHALCEPVNE